MKKRVVVLPGDGIGPEVIENALRVVDAALGVCKVPFQVEFLFEKVGGAAIDAYSVPLREETLELCKASNAVLLGAVGGPKWESTEPGKPRPEDGLLALRKGLGLFANLRPIKTYEALASVSPLKDELVRGVDILLVRELTGDAYFGKKERGADSGGLFAYDTMVYYEFEVERVVDFAFRLARRRRKSVVSVDKANVLESSRLWREVATRVASSFPDVEFKSMYVDNAAMQLVLNPRQFDVLVTGNVFGDILSDEGATLVGSIGMLPSASVAQLPRSYRSDSGFSASEGADQVCLARSQPPVPEFAEMLGLYEPVHGSAPDIAGKDVANPVGCILSCAMMMRYSLGVPEVADRIERAVEMAINEGLRTHDIYRGSGKLVSGSEMAEQIVRFLAR